MNSTAILTAITTHRAANDGDLPAVIAIDTVADTVTCHTFAQLEASVDPEWKPVHTNYVSIPDFYKDDIPMVLDTFTRTTIRDYLWTLLEYETRP